MAMTRDETIKWFAKEVEDLKNSTDTETFNFVMQGFASHMMGRPVGLEMDEEKINE
jgi:hypothetical protein